MAAADMDAVDFEPGEDDLLDEDVAMEDVEAAPAPAPRLRSAITGGTGPKRTKGRGFREESDKERSRGFARDFDSIASEDRDGSQRSIEGWIILVTGIHEEAQEDDVNEMFSEYGTIKNTHMNLDRRTGFVKGYALIEYEHKSEAQAAIAHCNGAKLLNQTLGVDWAFKVPPGAHQSRGGGGSGGGSRSNVRRRSPRGGHRSRSPTRRRF